ncbi:hypothetical protein [Vibrio sp. RE88]|uniref:hypothetical protein n=1 Tax=Vibrio sp. RE88 TaxID=2607610 RepID=UPI0014935162|nr:hypothetical protein [Vibrio sp. RE88]NOH63932.1 hypothetical protein [Vibrio sp. RE88]
MRLCSSLVNYIAVAFLLSSFSNVVPSLSGISSVMLVGLIITQCFYLRKASILAFLLPIGVLIFHGVYLYIGLAFGNGELEIALNNSRYLMVFLLFPTVCYIAQKGMISNLLLQLSKVVVLKAIFVSILAVGLLLGFGGFKAFSEHTAMLIHPFVGMYRVFDSFVIFFLLAFYNFKQRSTSSQFLLIVLMSFYVFISMSIGVIFVYLISIFFVLSKNYFHGTKGKLLLASVLAMVLILVTLFLLMFGHEYMQSLYSTSKVHTLIQDKLITSAGPKSNQVLWFLDNISLVGFGVGIWFDIQGRLDSMLEVLHVYWVSTYGVIGATIFYIFIVIVPFIKTLVLKRYEEIVILSGTFGIILLCSFTNPYALSGFVFLLLLLVYAFDSKVLNLNKTDKLASKT